MAARRLLDRVHPLGSGRAPSLALGIFWAGKCEGVLTFGFPISNNAVYSYGLRQDESLELRKMWISDVPPANSESRSLSVAVRLIAKQYPRIRLLLTYCDGEETATAYKASGWIPQKAHRYLRNITLAGGEKLSLRDFNRKGGRRRFGDAWHGDYVFRRKWVYLIDRSLAAVVQSSTPDFQSGDDGSRPIQPLS